MSLALLLDNLASRRRRTFFGVLIGILFLAAGTWLVFGIAHTGWSLWRLREGVSVPGQLQMVKRGSSRGSLDAAYTYTVNGLPYRGTQVSIAREGIAMEAPLREAVRTAAPVPVFIDPKEPGFATLDREVSWFQAALILFMTALILAIGVVGVFPRSRLSRSIHPTADDF
jgi:hypothetical protein